MVAMGWFWRRCSGYRYIINITKKVALGTKIITVRLSLIRILPLLPFCEKGEFFFNRLLTFKLNSGIIVLNLKSLN